MMDHELAVACALARQAGALILQHYAELNPVVEMKGKHDPVTEADRAANRLIVEGLRDAFPKDAILSEESVDNLARLQSPRLWCVDPLDGTRDYLMRNDEFVVMIGLSILGESRLGAVYQPTTDSLYAGVGRTAFCEERGLRRALRVSAVNTLDNARLMASRSHPSARMDALARSMRLQSQRQMGSVGLKMAQVADGQADLYVSITDRTGEWDLCAPEAILTAAGGFVSCLLGEPLRYNKPKPNTPRGVLATNGSLHTACIEHLRPVWKEIPWLVPAPSIRAGNP